MPGGPDLTKKIGAENYWPTYSGNIFLGEGVGCVSDEEARLSDST